jgi:sugar phosphate isomerase/epimerase
MHQLAIHTVGDELEASAEFCRTQGLGLEVTDFAFPSNLGQDVPARIRRHQAVVEGISPLSLHGPFFELVVTSCDEEIVAVARRRHHAALTAAREIGATLYIAHTNFNPLIREPTYRDNWAKRMASFWLPLADEAARYNITICFENVWEPGPQIQAELIETCNHPNLRSSFDNGHALLFSQCSASEWLAVLGKTLSHSHLHDNTGQTDEHRAVGEGKEDWPALMAALRLHAPQALLVAESIRLSANKLSLERLRQL